MFGQVLTRHLITASKKNIGQVFIQDNIQKLLKDITRFDESKIFARRPVPQLKSPKLMFMTNEQLDKAKKDAYRHVKARLQMPPVMEADTSKPEVLAINKEIVGYIDVKVMFVDISPGSSNRNRIMSVREVDGTLRFPTHEERTRLNHIYFPTEGASIDVPKLFEEKNMLRLMKNKEYLHILNRACVQFEPDDPRYIEITSKVYTYIDDKSDYDKLRSTRHFGPMSLFLAHNKRADGLIVEMLSKGLIEDATKLVKIYNTCHCIEFEDTDNHLDILKHYAENHSANKYNLDLALQNINTPS